MRPGSIGSPSLTWLAGSWAGTEATSLTSASTPPAEAPTTTMSWSGMDGPADQ
jgi:hypothetical protein